MKTKIILLKSSKTESYEINENECKKAVFLALLEKELLSPEQYEKGTEKLSALYSSDTKGFL